MPQEHNARIGAGSYYRVPHVKETLNHGIIITVSFSPMLPIMSCFYIPYGCIEDEIEAI